MVLQNDTIGCIKYMDHIWLSLQLAVVLLASAVSLLLAMAM